MHPQPKFTIPDPVYWTATELASFGEDVVHDLARAAVGTTCAYQVVLGRCLLAVDRTKLHNKFGCSGAIHYAVSMLGLGVKLARTLRRVARGLEDLPKLSRAAEQGKIPWGKLREIVPKASPETEQAWLALVDTRTYDQIQSLTRCTEVGKMPWEAESDHSPAQPTRYRYVVKPELGELFERGTESLSRKLGRYLTVTEAFEYLMVAQLQRQPVSERDLETARQEAARDAAARRRFNSGVQQADLEQAQEIVRHSAPTEEGQPVRSRTASEAETEPCSGPSERDFDPLLEPLETTRIPLGETFGGPAAIDAAIFKELSRTGSTSGQGSAKLGSSGEERDWSNPRLRFNPEARGVTPGQRRELLRRDGFQCRTSGCPNHAWLEVHHQQPYALHGPTVRGNLMNLCSRCHRNEQRGLLKISGDPEGQLRFVDAAGRDLCLQCAMEVAAWLDFWIGWTGGPGNSRQTRIANSA